MRYTTLTHIPLPRLIALPLLLLSLVIYAPFSSGLEHFSIARDWQTLHSEHFELTYVPEQQEIAEKAIQVAEDALPQLTEFFDWTPSDKIYITLSDQIDHANGYATPIPYNRVVLFTPTPNELNPLSDYNDWLRGLLIHELTHIVHMDKARGWSLAPRSIFGRNFFTFSNIFQPNFFKEGIATYIETSWNKRIGRGQGAFYNMVMRTEVASGLLPLSKAQQTIRDWPLDLAYSYGVPFYQFLDERYGQQALKDYIHTYSGQLIPFIVSRPVRHHTDQADLEALWNEYLVWLGERFQPQISAIQTAGLSEFKKITTTGYANDSPKYDDEGNLYYVAFDPYYPTALMRRSLDSEEAEEVTNVPAGTRVIGASKEDIWFLHASLCTHTKISYDLYQYNIEDDDSEQITDCAHYIEGDFNDGQVIATKVVNMKKQVVLYDTVTEEETVIFEGSIEENFSSPRWIDSQHIVMAYKAPNQAWAIRRYNIETAASEILVSDSTVNFFQVEPAGSTNEFIVSSDKNGVIELWTLNAKTKSLLQLTRSIGGATSPSMDADGKRFAYRQYNENGWDIALAEYKPVSQASVPSLAKPGTGFEAQWSGTAIETEQTDYSSLSSITPRSWFFGFSSDNAQTTTTFSIAGRDALNFHNWQINAGRDTDNDVNVFQAAYTAYNHLTLLYDRHYDYTFDSNDEPTLQESIEDMSAYFKYSFYGVNVFAGGNQQSSGFFDYANPILGAATRRIDTAGGGFFVNATQNTLYSISPSFGPTIIASFERDKVDLVTPFGSSETYGNVWSIDWNQYINLYQAHTLKFRAMLGRAEVGADPFDLTESPELNGFNQALIHRREYPLRGYPDDAIELIGRKAEIYSADYLFPIVNVDEGIAGVPLGMKNFYGAVFYESGQASNQYGRFDSVGIEFTLNLDVGFGLLPVSLLAGAAQPLDALSDPTSGAPKKKETNFYFGIGADL